MIKVTVEGEEFSFTETTLNGYVVMWYKGECSLQVRTFVPSAMAAKLMPPASGLTDEEYERIWNRLVTDVRNALSAAAGIL